VDVARGAERQARPDPVTFAAAVDQTGGRNVGVTAGALLEGDFSQWVLRAGAGYQERTGVTLPDGLGPDQVRQTAFLTRDGDLRLNSDSERRDAFLSARFLSDGGQWLSLAASGYQAERGVPLETHLSEPRIWRYPHQSRVISALTAGTGQRETALGEGDIELSVGFDLGRSEIDQYESVSFERVEAREESDDRMVTLRMLGDHSVGERGEVRAALTWADVGHDETLTPGGTASYRQRLWSLGSEVEYRLDHVPLFGLRTTRLTAGVALDGSDTPESGDKPPLETLWDWGARVGATSLSSGGRLLFHGGVSRRTRFPALRELYSGALGRFLPNPELRPEVLTGGELGFTYRAGESDLQLVGFHQRLADGIVRISVDTPEGPVFQRVNRDRIGSTGVEILAGTRVRDLTLRGDLTIQKVRGKGEEGGEVLLEYEPAWAGKLSAGLLLPASLVASADLRAIAEQRCENPEIGGLQRLDGSTSLDLGLRRAFRLHGGGAFSRAEASVAADNVTDALVLDQCGLPQPGRTLRFQVRLW